MTGRGKERREEGRRGKEREGEGSKFYLKRVADTIKSNVQNSNQIRNPAQRRIASGEECVDRHAALHTSGRWNRTGDGEGEVGGHGVRSNTGGGNRKGGGWNRIYGCNVLYF
jgi:hypothetical protein